MLLLTSSNGKCRLISHCGQHAGLMDQQWHMCSCASLVSRCVRLSATSLPIQAIFCFYCCSSINLAHEKRNHGILHCRSVCLSHTHQALGNHQLPPAGMGFVLPSRDHLCFVLNHVFFHLVHFGGAREGIIFGVLDSLFSTVLKTHRHES